MDRSRFQLEIDLQSISAISVATKLWDNPDIKNQIRSYFPKMMYTETIDDWNEMTKKVVKYSETLCLPSIVLNELQRSIAFIGEKIFNWIHHIIQYFGFPSIFAEKIYWTSYGTVDETKIFDFYWKDLTISNFSSKFHLLSPVFVLACLYVQEEFISKHQNDIQAEFGEHPRRFIGYVEKINSITTDIVSICVDSRQLKSCFSDSLRMFKICIQEGFVKAAKFYWERLDETEKNSNVIYMIYECLNKKFDFFIEEKHCELFIFLINEIPEEQKRTIFIENADCIIKKFLNVWPYQKMIVTLLHYDWDIIQSSKLISLLNFLIKFKREKHKCLTEDGLYYQILQKTWEQISNLDKHSFVLYNYQFLFQENCNIFFKLLKSSEETRKLLKEVYPLIKTEFIKEGKFKVLDKILDSLYDSNEERSSIKSQTDSVEICEFFISKHDFKRASEFVKWQFGSDKEIKNFKDIMREMSERVEPMVSKVYKIWSETSKCIYNCNYKPTVNAVSDLIDFYYNVEEADEFRKTNLNFSSAENLIDLAFAYLFQGHTYARCELLDEFFRLCMMSPDEIEEIRARYRKDIVKWMDHYVVKEFDLKKVEFLIDWLYGSREAKKEMCTKYFNLPMRAAVICSNYLTKMKAHDRLLNDLFNWLFWIHDTEKLKSDLRKLNKNPPEWFISLIDKLASKDEVALQLDINTVRHSLLLLL